MDAINTFLAGILSGINSLVHNYGWSIVVFTILIKLVLLPLDLKSRKSMRRMTSLQPQVAKLQKKYANDKEKLNQKIELKHFFNIIRNFIFHHFFDNFRFLFITYFFTSHFT